MTALIILYGHPDDEQAFETYYAEHHLPFAGEHMPGVTGATNSRVLGTTDGSPPPYHRVTRLDYPDADTLRAGIGSDEGRNVLADLDNFATGGATILIVED